MLISDFFIGFIMRARLLWVIGLAVYVSLILFCQVEIQPMPVSSGGNPVYICETVEELYNASNLIIRGKPSNVDIFCNFDERCGTRSLFRSNSVGANFLLICLSLSALLPTAVCDF